MIAISSPARSQQGVLRSTLQKALPPERRRHPAAAPLCAVQKAPPRAAHRKRCPFLFSGDFVGLFFFLYALLATAWVPGGRSGFLSMAHPFGPSPRVRRQAHRAGDPTTGMLAQKGDPSAMPLVRAHSCQACSWPATTRLPLVRFGGRCACAFPCAEMAHSIRKKNSKKKEFARAPRQKRGEEKDKVDPHAAAQGDPSKNIFSKKKSGGELSTLLE